MMYTKQDARMTQGLAILCMLVLHLFCRLGADVYGTPLIWLNDTTPLVYVFGFFAEICVPLYSLIVGYAQELLYEQGRSSWSNRRARILKLMQTYWIIVVLFSAIGLIKQDSLIPGSLASFVKTLFLLHSYNGAWWYLHSYVLLLLVPPAILLFPVRRLNSILGGGILCAIVTILWYILGRFGLRASSAPDYDWIRFILVELENLIGIMPAVWFGGFMCRYRLFDKAARWMDGFVPSKARQRRLFAVVIGILVIGFYLLHKSVLASFNAVAVFLIFNLWQKSSVAVQVFSFFGKHSTNIWLTHMFFYLCLFPSLVQELRYPLLMLLGLLVLSLAASFSVSGIHKGISRLTLRKYPLPINS